MPYLSLFFLQIESSLNPLDVIISRLLGSSYKRQKSDCGIKRVNYSFCFNCVMTFKYTMQGLQLGAYNSLWHATACL